MLSADVQAQSLRSQISVLGKELASKSKVQNVKVAVSLFPNLEGQICTISSFIAERLAEELSFANFSIVDSSKLEEGGLVIDKNFLANASSRAKITQITGADIIVAGVISNFGNTVEIDVRFAEISSGKTLSSAFVTISNSVDVSNVINQNCRTSGQKPARSSASGSFSCEDSDGAYQICSNGTVVDKTGKLAWQRESSGTTRDWEGAKQYCRNLDLGGFDNWRLPLLMEIQNIVSPTVQKGFRINEKLFPEVSQKKLKTYWTSTIVKFNQGKSWGMDFVQGKGVWEQTEEEHNVRCVRRS